MKRLLLALMLVSVLSGTALAGDMPGVGASVAGDVPTAGSTFTTEETPASVTGGMPGVGSATPSETDATLVTTVLLTIITLIGR